MKDKEMDLAIREKEISKKEDLIKKYEICNTELSNTKYSLDRIKDIVNKI